MGVATSMYSVPCPAIAGWIADFVMEDSNTTRIQCLIHYVLENAITTKTQHQFRVRSSN